MASTTGSVMRVAAAHLNDANQLVYDDEKLLPFLQMALDEMDEEFAIFEIPSFKKESIIILVPANSSTIPELPVDYVEAISLLERIQGSSDQWRKVNEELAINPNLAIQQQQGILVWTSRASNIYINPPTSDREVLLNYVSGLAVIQGEGDSIGVEAARRFLALVTAKNAARDLGNSPTKANSFEADITRARDRLVRRLHKNNQNNSGVRRRPYTGRRA